MKYTGNDVACLIPTKDRPEKLADLLESLVAQSAPVGRVLVIDGGESVRHVVDAFAGKLPVEWHKCDPPGQVRQRNFGISLITDHRLVACFDDDMVLEPEAFAEMLALWNSVDPETAGIGFNLYNEPFIPPTWLDKLLMLKSGTPGKVLPSGAHTGFVSLAHDIRTDWLGGGFTMWRKEILDTFKHREIRTRWDVGEDILFSYPVGRHFPLYACAKARARHEHVYDQAPPLERIRLGIYKGAVAQFILAYQQPSLSTVAALWSISGRLALYCVWELFHWRKEKLQRIYGLLDALKAAAMIMTGFMTPEQAQED